MIRISISLLLAVVALSGCSAFGGKSSFDCPLTQDGATCMSARQVYDATHVADRVRPNFRDGKPIDQAQNGAYNRADPYSESGGVYGASGSLANQPVPIVARDDYRPPYPEVDSPVPVRNPPRVMRIRLFPWEDASRDLNTGGFIFTEVAGRTWTLGEEQVSRVQQNVVSPLAVPPSRNSSPTSANQSPLQLPVPAGNAQRQQQNLPGTAKSGQAGSGLPAQPK